MKNLADHFMVSSDGSLYDARLKRSIREDYSCHHREINSGLELRATLRAGLYAWPGGYPLYFITSDGAALSFDSVREQFYQCAYSIRYRINDGWRIVGCDINYEDSDLTCDHSGKSIESAYGE